MSRLPITNRLRTSSYAQNSEYVPELIRNTEEVIAATGGSVVLLKKVSNNSSNIDTKGTTSTRDTLNGRITDNPITMDIDSPYWRQQRIAIPALLDLTGRSENKMGRRDVGTANVTIARATEEKLGVIINPLEDQFLIKGSRYRITSWEPDTEVLDNHTCKVYLVEKI